MKTSPAGMITVVLRESASPVTAFFSPPVALTPKSLHHVFNSPAYPKLLSQSSTALISGADENRIRVLSQFDPGGIAVCYFQVAVFHVFSLDVHDREVTPVPRVRSELHLPSVVGQVRIFAEANSERRSVPY